MNQILLTYEKNGGSTSKTAKANKRSKSTFFKFQFIICMVIAISIGSYYAYSLYENNKKEKFSQKLRNNFNITTLYSNSNTYSSSVTSTR